MLLRWGAWLSLNADAVVGADGDAGVSRPTHTHTDEWGERGSLFICGCGVKVPFSGKKKWWIMTLLCRKQPSLGLSRLGISEDD